MQSTAALKEYVDTAVKDILYEEASQIYELMERLDRTEELLGIAYAGFNRIATVLNYVYNSGGSARTNIDELCELMEIEIRNHILPPLFKECANKPHSEWMDRVASPVIDYRRSLQPDVDEPDETEDVDFSAYTPMSMESLDIEDSGDDLIERAASLPTEEDYP